MKQAVRVLGRQQQVTYLAVVHSPFCLYVSPFTTGIRGIFPYSADPQTQILKPDSFTFNNLLLTVPVNFLIVLKKLFS